MAKYSKDIVKQAKAWLGYSEKNGKFKIIIDTYNTIKPLPRGYKLKYTDEWCAGFISALAKKCGMTDIIPCECSCPKMVELFKKKGCWKESDTRIPNIGDIIFYDWQDNGVGDNKGSADHVGIVAEVYGNMFTVIEGNKGESVAKREFSVNSRYIRGYGTPKYDKVSNKSDKDIAKEVIAGKWGNGSERKKKLEEAGYNYSVIQGIVNDMLDDSNLKPTKEIAKEVIAGKWGNGAERVRKLEAAGYNYDTVQREVNKMLGV